jgi:hypothetical protein
MYMVASWVGFFFSSPPRHSIVERPATPARRDNISILPLEWLSGKLKNFATFGYYAPHERHQSLL